MDSNNALQGVLLKESMEGILRESEARERKKKDVAQQEAMLLEETKLAKQASHDLDQQAHKLQEETMQLQCAFKEFQTKMAGEKQEAIMIGTVQAL